MESGEVHINSMTVHDEFALPHGGIKNSGFGRFNGYHGLDEFLYLGIPRRSLGWNDLRHHEPRISLITCIGAKYQSNKRP